MCFSDLALARRLERAEGFACAQFAAARRRAFPESGSEFAEFGGVYAAFDGKDAPTTQTFGLGLFEPVTDETLSVIERFFFERGASVDHEVSPLAGVEALNLLCARGYRPIEVSNVLWQPVHERQGQADTSIRVRVASAGEAEVWARTNTEGWTAEHPELRDFLLETGRVLTGREGSAAFLAELNGQPAAAGMLSLHEGVALFAGSSTVPRFRGRGLQAALLTERMRYARQQGCDVAMVVTETGSGSQRNAERQGFRVAYTRIKWRLALGAAQA